MRRSAASRQGFDPSVSFSGRRTHTFDPQETVVVAVALWLVSERSGRTTRRLTENYSALWKAFHKADYAKYRIMESCRPECLPNAGWQRQKGIPTFA